MKKQNYIDNVLIKLRRLYSKDEFVSALLKKYSELEIENGILKSEKYEAVYNLEQFTKLSNDRKSQICQRKYYRNQVTEIKSLREKLRKLKIDNSKLVMLKIPIKL